MVKPIVKHFKRSKYLAKEEIYPNEYTIVHLNARGRRALEKLEENAEDRKNLVLDLTGGGGIGENGEIYIYPYGKKTVSKLWRKIHNLLNKYDKKV